MPSLPTPTSHAIGVRFGHRPLVVVLALCALVTGSLASAASTIDPSSFSTVSSTVWQFIVDHSSRAQGPTCYSTSRQQSQTYNCLMVALATAGLDQTLRDAGPVTLFAPTDAGFAELADLMGSVAFTDLMSQPEKLKPVLQGLMVAGRYTSADLKARSVGATGRASLPTLAGTELPLTFGRFPSASGRVEVEIGNAVLRAWKAYLTNQTTLLNNGSIIPIDMVVLPDSFR